VQLDEQDEYCMAVEAYGEAKTCLRMSGTGD
jgi:hypothetical protein